MSYNVPTRIVETPIIQHTARYKEETKFFHRRRFPFCGYISMGSCLRETNSTRDAKNGIK